MRLLVVSNRLPIHVAEKDDKFTFGQSAGGLVSGLSAYLASLQGTSASSEYIWVGWPGITVKDNLQTEVKSEMQANFNAYPVFLPQDAMDDFYHGFCNKIIWPLFHYMPSYTVFDEAYWTQYQQVNEVFCQAVMDIIKPGDLVWVHDYHLMLLPMLLRRKMPDVPIGFFLHIPFPSFEIFRILPENWRTEILTGLLGADLIGFHTHEYTQYFLRSVRRILGYQNDMGIIRTDDRIVKAGTFPMGIDFDRFNQTGYGPEAIQERNLLKESLAEQKVVLSVDRLDYTKGIINRLRGYQTFLHQFPQYQGQVVLLLVVVPSRIGVESYQQMERQINELVGEINGKFGTINWTPIIYQYKFLPFDQLVALYGVSDVALVTPLRDGMNLIAKEYIAARRDQTGVLILSEMAGTSKEMGEAIIINPNDINGIAQALALALEMPPEEQIRRNQVMQARLKRYNVIRWSGTFINTLLSVQQEQQLFAPQLLDRQALLRDFRQAGKRLILLDYDGTLVPFTLDPQAAKPSQKLLDILHQLSADCRSEVCVISGRPQDTLENWLGRLNLSLICEHGAKLKNKGGAWRLIKPMINNWKPRILPILERYADRLPGSFVEEKEFAVTWHYRQADPKLGATLAKELMDDLIDFANVDVQVLQGSKVIEVRSAGMTKATAGQHWLTQEDFDFILAIGDDWTDEDLFRALPSNAYSIKVGLSQSYARFNLLDYTEVIGLLQELIRQT